MYPPEILPLKIRAKGSALAAAADFLGNFLVVEVTPDGIKNLGWRFYLVWAVLNLVNAIVVWIFYPETGGQPLEAIDALFVDQSDRADRSRFQIDDQPLSKSGGWLDKMQWSVVPRAHRQVRMFKRGGGRRLSRTKSTGVEHGR